MGASYGKLMMWFFLLSDAFTFSGLLITYGLVRSAHPAFVGTGAAEVRLVGSNEKFTAKWSTGSTDATLSLENKKDYSVVITTAKGCTATVQFRVEQAVEKVARAFSSPLNCSGQSIGAVEVVTNEFSFSPAYWPVPEKVFDAIPFFHGVEAPLVFVGIMTFILIMSSVTMVLAVEAGHRMDRKAVEKWMLWTIVGGITFLACQAWEWTHFIVGTDTPTLIKDFVFVNGEGQWITKEVFGANLKINQYGPQDFADFFFFITGFHGFHVFSGVLLNFLIYYNTVTGVYERRGHYEMVEKVGLYWHFVDLVWVFVFTFFYLV